MANSYKVASVIAREAVDILKNNLVMGDKVHRAHESEFAQTVNGYKKGDTITIRRPADFTVTDGAVMDVQDIVEGSTSLVIDQRKHVAFGISSQDMTLKLSDLRERVIKPAAIQLANKIDMDCMGLYKYVPGWVGTPGQTINSFSDFYKGPERLNEFGVPVDRCAVLSPADESGMLGSQTSLYITEAARGAYRRGSLGMIGGTDTYMSQNVPTHTNGDFAGTVLVDQALTTSTTAYADVKDTMTQTLHIDGLTTATAALKAGDTFTIDDVYAVNPVTKEALPFLKQFTVMADATAASNEVDLTIYPALIWSGAHQTVSVTSGVTDLNNKAVTFVGTGATGYRQNMVFHKNAFALAMVPLEVPAGSVDTARFSEDGFSIRVQPVYDGINDVSQWRMDVLYGVKAIDPRLATRLSGTA